MEKMKSNYDHETDETIPGMGRSYYCFCLEQALVAVAQARALVKGDQVDTDHELPKIERLLVQALEAA